MKICLTIAGSDSTAGAGIQADLKTFHSLGVYGVSVVTSVTAQNSLGVHDIYNLPPDSVEAQLRSLLSDISVHAVKVGMLSVKPTVDVVARILSEHRIETLVIDPVMVSKNGATLLEDDARQALKETLLPMAKMVTPNIYEASWLSGVKIAQVDDMIKAAVAIKKTGVEWVFVKGGHLEGEVADVLCGGEKTEVLNAVRNGWKEIHGTGCILASAIVAGLAKGFSPPEAVRRARLYLQGVVSHSIKIGKGWEVALNERPPSCAEGGHAT